MYRNTYVNINLSNLEHNVKEIIKNYNYKYYIGVVKANCYGHGYGIINTLLKSGINYFAVANLDEALEVRNINNNVGILCLEPISKKYLKICSDNNISIVIDDKDYYKEIRNLNFSLKIHLKIDSGMNRIGFNNINDIDYFIKDLNKHNNLYLEGIFTHFATSGYLDNNYQNQLNTFINLTKNIDLSKIEIVHLDKGGTLTIHERIPFENGIRLGYIMYGYEKIEKESKLKELYNNLYRKIKKIKISKVNNLDLLPAFEFISEVFEVKNVKKNSYVGYGLNCKLKKDTKIAIIDTGYKDGISTKRLNSYFGINNKKYKVIAICMGMTILEVDDSVKKHDKVYIIGNNINISDVAKKLDTHIYETLCLIDSSIERKYIK